MPSVSLSDVTLCLILYVAECNSVVKIQNDNMREKLAGQKF